MAARVCSCVFAAVHALFLFRTNESLQTIAFLRVREQAALKINAFIQFRPRASDWRQPNAPVIARYVDRLTSVPEEQFSFFITLACYELGCGGVVQFSAVQMSTQVTSVLSILSRSGIVRAAARPSGCETHLSVDCSAAAAGMIAATLRAGQSCHLPL